MHYLWYIVAEFNQMRMSAMIKEKRKLSELKNIGPTIEKTLNEIGIKSKSDLERIGPATAYKRIQKKYPDKSHLIMQCDETNQVITPREVGINFMGSL